MGHAFTGLVDEPWLQVLKDENLEQSLNQGHVISLAELKTVKLDVPKKTKKL